MLFSRQAQKQKYAEGVSFHRHAALSIMMIILHHIDKLVFSKPAMNIVGNRDRFMQNRIEGNLEKKKEDYPHEKKPSGTHPNNSF